MSNKHNNIDMVIEEGRLIKKLNTVGRKFNNEAYLYKYIDNYYVIRKIGKQYNLSPYKLVKLEKNLNTYYHELRNLNKIVNLPQIFYTKIIKKENFILLVTEYFPKGKITELKNISEKVKYFKIRDSKNNPKKGNYKKNNNHW